MAISTQKLWDRCTTKKNILVFLSGSAFEITPGQIGVLIKSQILKSKFDIPRTKTAPIVLVEKVYDLIGAILASINWNNNSRNGCISYYYFSYSFGHNFLLHVL